MPGETAMHWPEGVSGQRFASWMQTFAPWSVGSFGMGSAKAQMFGGVRMAPTTTPKIVGPTAAMHGAIDGPQNPPFPKGPGISTGAGGQGPITRMGAVDRQGTPVVTEKAAFPTVGDPAHRIVGIPKGVEFPQP